MPKKKKQGPANISVQARLDDRYTKGKADMEQRKTRKSKGWDAGFDVYMGKFPSNWPYTSRVNDPRIRTTILEKTARLLNAKLRGRLVPREGADIVSARVNNALVDFQWENAVNGGPMIEKVAKLDNLTRLIGASFAHVYWDQRRETNEFKPWDPRDIFIDPTADHIRNAKWVLLREWTTLEALKARGYEVGGIELTEQMQTQNRRDTEYQSAVLQNRGLEDRVGDDKASNIIELVTEWTPTSEVTYLPKFKKVIRQRKNIYKHGKIPVVQLRYYPIQDDIYGESEVEPVIALQRGIDAFLCGFLDEMNLAMRPPLKINATGVRMETIEYGPGARWIMNNLNNVDQAAIGGNAVRAFNNTYPALVAAFNTAVGDQSLGISNIKGFNTEKTATEVEELTKQQNNRDQYNQLYLGEMLKEAMLMWVSNNQQFLFADESKHFIVAKVLGRNEVNALKKLRLNDEQVPADVSQQLGDLIETAPDQISDEDIKQLAEEITVPRNAVVLNPNDRADQQKVKPKMEMLADDEANLFITREDMSGVFDYIPDVKSMAAGASQEQKSGRRQALELALSRGVREMLESEGRRLKVSELMSNVLEDAGIRDAESLFEDAPVGVEPGQEPLGAGDAPSLPGSGGVPTELGQAGLSEEAGLPIPG